MAQTTLAELNACSKADFVAALANISEYSPWSAEQPAESRLPNDASTEMQMSVMEIFRIAALRLDQAVASEDRLPVRGRLSTHVLDTHSGKPAAGIAVELIELSELGASRVVTRAITNADG